jgi:hypothetical protein
MRRLIANRAQIIEKGGRSLVNDSLIPQNVLMS